MRANTSVQVFELKKKFKKRWQKKLSDKKIKAWFSALTVSSSFDPAIVLYMLNGYTDLNDTRKCAWITAQH